LGEIQSKYSNVKNEGISKRPTILSRIGLEVMNSNRVLTNFNKKNHIGNNNRIVNSNLNHENKNILNLFNRSNSYNNNFSHLEDLGVNGNNSISIVKYGSNGNNNNFDDNTSNLNSNYNKNSNSNSYEIDNFVNASLKGNNNNYGNFSIKANNKINSKIDSDNSETNNFYLNNNNKNNNNNKKFERHNVRINNANKSDNDMLNNNNTKSFSENEEQKIISSENILTNQTLNNYNSNNYEVKNTNNSNKNLNKNYNNNKNNNQNKNQSNNQINSNSIKFASLSQEKVNYKKINNLNNLINLTNPNSNNNINNNNSANNSPQNSINSQKLPRFLKEKTRNDALLALLMPDANSTAILNSSLVLEMLNNMDLTKDNINLSYKSIILNSAHLNNTFDIENLDSITEGKLLKNSLWENKNFIKAVKLLEFWLDIENSLENKSFVVNLFKRFFTYIKTEISVNVFIENISFDFFHINNLNIIFAKIIKILVFITSVFYVIHQNFALEASLKGHMKKLASSLSNPLLNYFEFLVFNNKKFVDKILEGSYLKPDFLEKYNKLLKMHKIIKGTKAPEALINIIKSLDSCLLIIKQFSK
jgi:hypothetical protein